MNVALAYDSETTGLVDFKAPSEAPHQPHIVQLAAMLVDLDTWKTIASLDVIVRPEGWTIPDEAAAIHGVTTERALKVGVPESLAVELLLELHKQAAVRVAHNEGFDARIVRIACKRFFDEATADEWKAGKAECTQLLSTPILKLPPTEAMLRTRFKNNFKSANLREAYEFFTGKPLQNAHSAIADVRGCLAVYRAIKAGQTTAAAAPLAA